MKARPLSMLLWDYLKCMKQLATPSIVGKFWTNPPCDCFCGRWRQQLGIYGYTIMTYYWLWIFEVMIMKVFVLGMWCLRCVNMEQMMIKFLWVWLWWLWKKFKLICIKQLHGRKIKERKVGIGKCMHWKVGNDIKLKTLIKKKVCQQSYNVWGTNLWFFYVKL